MTVVISGEYVKIVNSRLAEISVNIVEKLLTDSRYRDATGRIFGIVKLSFQSLVAYFRRFLVPGLALRGRLILGTQRVVSFTQYVSFTHIGELSIVDISPLLYLDQDVSRETSAQLLAYDSAVVSTDLLEYAEFILEPPQ